MVNPVTLRLTSPPREVTRCRPHGFVKVSVNVLTAECQPLGAREVIVDQRAHTFFVRQHRGVGLHCWPEDAEQAERL